MNRMMKFLFSLGLVLCAACGDDSSTSVQGSMTECDALAATYCDLACDCMAGDACRIGGRAEGDADAGVVISSAYIEFDHQSECHAFMNAICISKPDAIDIERCISELGSSTCIEEDSSLDAPDSCYEDD